MTDPELEQFVQQARPARAPLHPVRAVAVAATWLLLAFLLWPTRDELLAHFRAGAPLDVPDPAALQGGAALPLGSQVRLHGVLGNRAASLEGWRQGSLRMGPVEVRQVLGAPLFIEYDAARYPRFTAFSEVDVQGRVASFGPDTEIPELRAYLRLQGIDIPDDARLLVLDEGPGLMTRYVLSWTGGMALSIFALLWLLRRRVVA